MIAFDYVRMALAPVTSFASNASFLLEFEGMLLGLVKLAMISAIAFGIVALFQLITLPVEFDASKRAKEQLLRLGIVRAEESPGVSRVLNAAALTYVAALVSSVMQLLYFLTLARNSRN